MITVLVKKGMPAQKERALTQIMSQKAIQKMNFLEELLTNRQSLQKIDVLTEEGSLEE
jgi:hypothetical protein